MCHVFGAGFLFMFVPTGRPLMLFGMALVLALILGPIVWGLRRLHRRTLARWITGIFALALLGVSAWIEWQCAVEMSVPPVQVGDQMQDNDGAVRMLMLIAAAWLPFLVLGLLALLAAWLVPAGKVAGTSKVEN